MPPGVTNTTQENARKPAAGKPANKNRKWLIYGGGGLAAILLLSHKGGAAGGSQPSSQDQLSAYQSGVTDAANLIGNTTGASGIELPTGNGAASATDGTADTPGTVAPSGGVGPVQIGPIEIAAAGAVPPGTGAGGTTKPGKKKTKTVTRPGGKQRRHPVQGSNKTPAKTKRAAHPKAGTPAVAHRTKPGNAPRPKTAARTKPAPAARTGGHPNTSHKTPHGAKRRSPAEVESIFGAGSGQVVMGRQFPGAISHRIGPAQRAADGTITRVVVVDYGGHTDRLLCHGNGKRWTDNPMGLNPPSRGTPIVTDPIPV